MQEFNSIYKFDVEQSELGLIEVAKVVSPSEYGQGSFCFSIKTDKELTILLSKTTQLFHQEYFRLEGNPLIIVQSTYLESLFLEKFRDLSFGNFTIINIENNGELVSFQPSQNSFNKWYNEGNVKNNFYFISKDLIEFNKWKKSLTQHQINQLIHTFTFHQQLHQLNVDKNQLIAKNNLLNQSLNAIKIEYNKELDWYKSEIKNISSEIENINKWYHNQYYHLPNWFLKLGCIFKFFKEK